jgi:nicotinamide mononucleotide transporter
MEILEWIGIATGIIYLLLLTFLRREGWWFGIISCACYAWLSFKSQLLLQSGLQTIYVALGFYGFFQWGKPEHKIQILGFKKHLIYMIPAFLGWAVLYFLFNKSEQEQALLDAFICSFAILATYLSTQSILHHWWYWIVLNMLTVWLFWEQGLNHSMILYGFNAVMAVYAYSRWKNEFQKR